jgi:hypothetical protein
LVMAVNNTKKLCCFCSPPETRNMPRGMTTMQIESRMYLFGQLRPNFA